MFLVKTGPFFLFQFTNSWTGARLLLAFFPLPFPMKKSLALKLAGFAIGVTLIGSNGPLMNDTDPLPPKLPDPDGGGSGQGPVIDPSS